MFKALSKLNTGKSSALRIGALVLAVLVLLCCRPSFVVPVHADEGNNGAIGSLVNYGARGLGALTNAWKELLFGSDGSEPSGRSFIGDAVSRVTLGELVKKGADGVGDLLTWFNNAVNNQQDISDPSTFNTVYNNYITQYNYNYAGNGVITCPIKYNLNKFNSFYLPHEIISDTKVKVFTSGYESNGGLKNYLSTVNYKFDFPGYASGLLHFIITYTSDGINYSSFDLYCKDYLNYHSCQNDYISFSASISTSCNFYFSVDTVLSGNCTYIIDIAPDSYLQYIASGGSITNIDNSTRITDITNDWGDTITNIDNGSGDTSYITTNEGGDTYYIFPIFNEGNGTGTNGTFIDPEGYSHTVNNWSYDYSDRSYHFTEEVNNTDNSVTTNDYSVTYGDEYVTIDKRVTTTDNSTNTTTNNYTTNNYYYAVYDPSLDPDYPTTNNVPNGGGGSGGGGSNTGITIPDFEFDGSWLSDAIGMIFVLLTSLMDHNNELLVNSGGYNANLNVSGTVDLNVNLPAPTGDGSGSGSGSDGGGSGSGSGDDGGSGSGSLQLLDVNQLVEVIMTPFNLIGSFLQSVAEGITAFIENTLSLMTDMTELLGGFGFFISSFFLWMPPEIRVVVISGFSILFGLSVIKLFRGG